MNYLICLLICFCAGARANAQSEPLAALTAPDSLREGANSVVVSYDYDVEVTSKSTAELHYRKVVTLLNAKAAAESRLVDFYDGDSKITSFEMATYDAFGRETFRSRKSDIVDQRYDDNMSFQLDTWLKIVEAPCGSYPCTVVTEVAKKLSDHSAVNSLPTWAPVGREQSLLTARLRVTVPAGNEVLFENRRINDPVVASGEKTTTYEWSLSNIVAQSTEPLCPPVSETLPYVRTVLADFQIEGYNGSFRSWKEYGKFRRDIMEGRDVLPAALATEVHETVDGVADEREKIDRLYRLMQQRCRYVSIQIGLGGWQPFSAEFVEQNRYGDCKALTNYMYAMLKEVGIESYPVTIYWGDNPEYNPHKGFTTPASNHMILYVPSQQMYLECTSNDAPTGYLGEGKDDRMAMWITPEGGQLERTPALQPGEHGHIRTVRLDVQEDNSMAFSLEGNWFGAEQESFRSVGSYFGNGKDQREWLHRNNFLPDVSGGDYTFDVLADEPVVRLNYKTVLPGRVRSFGSRRFVSVNPFPQSWVPDPVDDRRLPVVFSRPRMLVDTVHLSFPNGLEIESGLLTEPLVYEHPAGEYRAEMRAGENSVTWIRTLLLRSVSLPAEAYADFRQFFIDLGKAESVQLVLREQRTK